MSTDREPTDDKALVQARSGAFDRLVDAALQELQETGERIIEELIRRPVLLTLAMMRDPGLFDRAIVGFQDLRLCALARSRAIEEGGRGSAAVAHILGELLAARGGEV